MDSQTTGPDARTTAARGRGLKAGLLTFASTLAVLPIAHGAAAQTSPTQAPATSNQSATVEEVIVTAQKRRENLQDVPVVVSAITAGDALKQGLTSTESLSAAVPGLVMTNPANVGNPYLRGVGSNLFDPSSEQSVALYVDGVYIASPQADLFNFNNISDIEVLKGPQGTLFGRNATGGVIQITTDDPSFTPKGNASVGYGNYDDVTASAYASTGLGDKVAIDGAFLYENQGEGYGRNLTTGDQTFKQAIGNYSLRSKVLFKPLPDTKVVVSFDFSHSVSSNSYQKPPGTISPFDGSTYPGPYNALADENDRDIVNTGGASIRVDQGIGDFHLMDIVSYRRTAVEYRLDDDVTAVPAVDLVLEPRARNFTEELQLSSPTQGWLKWVVGFFYYNADAGYFPQSFDGMEQISDTQHTESYSGFGQLTATVAPNTNITLGARYTDESQDFTLFHPLGVGLTESDSQSFSRMTYRAAIDYHFTRDIMAYASYNTGFKSGGFNLLKPGNDYRPEFLDAYEVGLKTELFDRRLRLNVGGFYYDDSNVQVLSSFAGGTITSNAAGAEIKGLEGDFKFAATQSLRISGGLALQKGRYTSYPDGTFTTAAGATTLGVDLKGNDTLVTPHVTGNLSVDDTWRTEYGDLNGSLTLVHNSGFYWQAENRLTQPSYTLLNASLIWTPPGDRYSVRLWARNLTDATYYVARLSVTGLGDVQEQAAPRTFGFTVGVKF